MKTRAFLIFCAVGLVPIALGYGAKPAASLDALFGITVDTTNLTHIMRAVMGLYFGMVVIWLWGCIQSLDGRSRFGCLCGVHAWTCRGTSAELRPGRHAALVADCLCVPGDRAWCGRRPSLQVPNQLQPSFLHVEMKHSIGMSSA